MKLTTTSYALIALLDQLGEATSYDIKQALEKSIENFWPVPHTTAYEEPARLAEGGYLSVKQEPGGRRRKIYTVTKEGRRALRAWADTPSTAPPQLRDEVLLKVFAGADPDRLLPARVEWHRAKLEELRDYLEEVRKEEGWDPSERTLIAGVGYHERMIELLESLQALKRGVGQAPAASPAAELQVGLADKVRFEIAVSDALPYGNAEQLGDQALAALAGPVYAFTATYRLLKLIALVTPLRSDERTEAIGMDVSQHGEEAYATGEGAILITPETGVDEPVPVANPG